MKFNENKALWIANTWNKFFNEQSKIIPIKNRRAVATDKTINSMKENFSTIPLAHFIWTFSKDELELMLEWYKYVVMTEDVPIHQANIDLAYKIQKIFSSV